MATFPTIDLDTRSFRPLSLEEGSPFGGVLSNAIAKRLAMAKAQEAEAEVPYAGLSKLASILSQSAYASAVTPQFQAKLLGIPGATANLKNPQSTLDRLAGLGTPGASTGNVLQDFINKELLKISQGNQSGIQSGFGGIGAIASKLKNLFMGGGEEQTAPNAPNAPQEPIVTGYNGGNANQSQTQGFVPITQNPAAPLPQNPSARSTESQAWSKNQGEAAKVVAKGTQLGKEQGTQQAEYGPAAQGAIAQSRSLDQLSKIYNKPEIKKIADVPFASGKSVAWYKQSGTDAERKAIGNMESAENAFISASFNLFPGRVTNNDLTFLMKMKPNENDPLPVRLGKIEEIKRYTEYRKQQIKLADKYMEDGMSQTQAEFKADEEVKLNDFMEQAYNKFPESNPIPANTSNDAHVSNITPEQITVKNIQHTAQEMGISVPEVIKRLKKKGINIPEGAINAY